MNKFAYMAGVALAAMAISSCDDDTLTIGSSLTNEGDKLLMTPATITDVTTRTIVANPDSVISLSSKCFLGKVKDPETKTTVTSEFSTQFNVLEYMYVYPESDILSKDENGEIIADSCDLIIYLSSPYKSDDSLTAMKLRISELSEPIPNQRHYVNYDPTPLLRKDEGCFNVSHMFSFQNRIDTDSLRNTSDYTTNFRIQLNQPYSKDGKTYKNYGTYLLRQYFANKSNFSNPYIFAKNICPGFFFQIADGLGFYSQISNIGLRTYYKVQLSDTTHLANMTFAGTKEVLQTARITNDQNALKNMANEDTTWTYLKSPAGLFTEVTLPIDKIMQGHENDSLMAASIVFQRMNNESTDKRTLDIPQTILMVPRDSLYTYFENNKVPDGKTAFMTSFSSTTNTYSFTNISNIIYYMWGKKQSGQASVNWNKVVLVPISYTLSSSTSSVTKIEHDMSLSSAKLVRGRGNNISINVVYGKFQN